jgi:two-component system, LytTR family, sensor kinase
MQTRPRDGYLFWALQLGGWTAYAVALMVPWLGRYPLSVMWSNKLVIASTGLLTSSGLRAIYRRVAREGASIPALSLLAVAASVAGAFAWNAAASAILGRSLLNDSVLLGALGTTLPRFDGVLYHALVLLTWSSLYLGARHYRALITERERTLRAESLAREARLLALRYQIGPHFLFNALNAVSTLVVTDRKADATATIARLADLLRVSLEPPENGMIPLRTELAIVDAYVAVERVRFADRLLVSVDADPHALDYRVPSMILQPLVENAVRHAVAVRDDPTTIRISCHSGRSAVGAESRNRDHPDRETCHPERSEGSSSSRPRGWPLFRDGGDSSPPARRASARNDYLILTVSDNGCGIGASPEGLGIGLANIRARLDELYPDTHTFIAGPTPAGGFRAEISMPGSSEPSVAQPTYVFEAQLA